MTRVPAAFFDIDKTILRANSGVLWMRFLRRRGEIGRLDLLRSLGWAVAYRLAVLDMERLSRRLVATMAGEDHGELVAKSAVWYREDVEHHIAAAARRAIDRHRAHGDRCVILTSSTQYVAGAVGGSLGIADRISSVLEVEGGKLTGRIEPFCFGPSKVEIVERWAAAHGVDLARSTFYTDSYNDLPMLERIGRPVAVNPDPRLLRVARRRGWPVEIWDRDEPAAPAAPTQSAGAAAAG